MPPTTTLFLSLPSDVLDRIALQTVIQPVDVDQCDGLLPRLETLSSLLLLCRYAHTNLSPSTNAYLYGQIFRLLFDVTPIERRLGADAVRSTVLTHELHRRLHMLKRIRTYLSKPGPGQQEQQQQRHLFSQQNLILDLSLLLFMLTESDGKNHEQIRHVLGPSGVANLCSAILLSSSSSSSSSSPFPSADITLKEQEEVARTIRSLALVILWINQDDVYESESHEKTEALLDILEPLAIQSQIQAPNRVFVGESFTYFGLSCSLTPLSSALAYTRLCIVERYDAIKRQQSNLTPPSSRLQSDDIDADFLRLTKFHHSSSLNLSYRSPPPESITSGYGATLVDHTQALLHNTHRVFEGEWDGGWFVPSLLEHSVYTVYQSMRFHIRAYVASSPDGGDQFANDNGEHNTEREEFTRTFNEGVEFTERAPNLHQLSLTWKDSLTIYDPIAGQTSFYEPRSPDNHHSATADTILYGETTAAHGATFGDFVLYGRTQSSDGRVFLVRRPANPDMEDLGVWVFDGYIYGGRQFVGDWWNTSTTKDAPGGSGWFRLTKVTQ